MIVTSALRRAFCLLLVLGALSAAADPSASESTVFHHLEAFIEEQMRADGIPGLSIAVWKEDVFWEEGFGFADLENRTKAHAASSYRIASVAKPMTAAAVLKLVEQGKMDLDTDVRTYVPYYPAKPWPVTVRHLLGHLGGVSHYRDPQAEMHFKTPRTTREAIAVFADFDLECQPGTCYTYTSYGYNLLGAAIEEASGLSYGDFLRQEIWQPLGMAATRMDDPEELIPHRVRGYRRVGGEIRNSEFIDISSRFAAGGHRSTVGDMIRFARGLAAGALLRPDTVHEMMTPLVRTDGFRTNYGFGWVVRPLNGRFHVLHAGGQPETSTLLVYIPTQDFAVAVAANLESANLMPYIRRAHQLLVPEGWNTASYVGGRAETLVYRALDLAYNEGMAFYDRYGRASTDDAKTVAAAFDALNQLANLDSTRHDIDTVERRTLTRSHPIGERLWTHLGSFMARQMAAEGIELDPYHELGAISFFHDYAQLAARLPDQPRSLRLNAALRAKVAAWEADWRRVWTPETRRLQITPNTELEPLERRLRDLFADARAIPYFGEEIVDLARTAFFRGDVPRAQQAARLAWDLYPEDGLTNGALGIVLVLLGDTESGRARLTKSAEADPAGPLGPRGLLDVANAIESMGQAGAAITLLEVAIEVHAENASLRARLGDLYRHRNEPQKAARFYREALRLDEDHPSALNGLSELRDAPQ